ncbi:MAG: hypothetical protein LBN05_04540 [Oscillospiraceae bacterium]|jgi:hypothetical protein|nr:hypothetical protein [Oscillospiraceae bacterium]
MNAKLKEWFSLRLPRQKHRKLKNLLVRLWKYLLQVSLWSKQHHIGQAVFELLRLASTIIKIIVDLKKMI